MTCTVSEREFSITIQPLTQSLICPKLMMNPGTEIVGPRNIRHKLRNINEAVRKVDATVRQLFYVK